MLSKYRLWCLLCMLIFIASCAGSSTYMKTSETLMGHPGDKALVRFMRPSGYGYAQNFNMLDGEKVIGNSVAKSQFDYLTDPGKHLFIATAENKAFLEADLLAGKTYYVITRIYMGAWTGRVALVPVTRDSEFWDKVIEYENTSSTLLSPNIFRKHVLPFLNEYAEILKAAGKIYLIHMCGRLRAFKEDLAAGGFHGIIDAPPPPTGDFPLDEAAASLPGKVVIGGVDPTTFICPDPAFVEAEISGLLERLKPFRGVMLGSADVAPRGALPENFKLIRRLIDTVGAYNR